MPAGFSALFDTLLVIAGLVLVVTGLVMFVRSKTSTQASSVEAFGIKLNVTHPSLILVLAGVGLMLAPRLLPELPEKEAEPKPVVVAEAPPPEAAKPTPATPAESPPATAPTSPPPATAAVPTQPPKAAAVPAPHPAAPASPPAVAIAQAARPVVRAKPKPPAQAATPKNATPAASPPPAVAAAAPPAVAPSARPMLAYAALGLPISRSFWNGETRASYTQRMHAALHQAGREILRMDARGLELGQKEFDAWWNESNQRPKSRELCAATPAPAALLSARVETPTTISSAESAYWPELKLRLFVCANQRIHRQQKTLAPQNDDAWPFSVELNSEIERFLRTYRNDLAD